MESFARYDDGNHNIHVFQLLVGGLALFIGIELLFELHLEVAVAVGATVIWFPIMTAEEHKSLDLPALGLPVMPLCSLGSN